MKAETIDSTWNLFVFHCWFDVNIAADIKSWFKFLEYLRLDFVNIELEHQRKSMKALLWVIKQPDTFLKYSMKTILMKVFKERNLVSNLRNSIWVYNMGIWVYNLIGRFSKFAFSANKAINIRKWKFKVDDLSCKLLVQNYTAR